MVKKQKRNSFLLRLAAAAAIFLVALPSCGGPAGGGKRPAPGPEDSSDGQVFSKIGSRSITDAAGADSFTASRCLFQDDGLLTHVPMECSLKKAAPQARQELNSLLAALQQARTAAGVKPAADDAGAGLPRRVYQLHPQSDWIIDLSLGELAGDAGGLRAACNLRNKGEKAITVMARAPLLLKFLREEAAAALLAQMNRPRVPLERHYQALAGFLDTGALSEGELKRARRVLIAKVGKSANKTALVSSLLEHLNSFDEADMAALDSDGSIAPRVFYLAWSANRGLKKNMGELLVLSLEFHGEAILFQRALKALFAEKENKRLYALNPPGKNREGALAFLRGLRESMGKADYHREKGWVLDP